MNRIQLIRKLLSYTNLESEIDDFDKIHETIEKDLVFKGTNLWILIFAILVASVGLNMNSTAVIIGAMLISPLMGPINGMGYSIATYNFPLFRKAVKNFAFAVGASLVASTGYFALSPISTAHSELLARTNPTIYDVLIAFLGGMAGIVAISSRQKGNVIPGVAIATALMPPLCTAGYGLATGQFYYFFGAFYLFTINTVFIALAALVVSQVLKFPITTLVDAGQKKQVNRWISTIITLVLIPSIYFGYALVQKEKFVENATKYVNNISVVNGNYLLKHAIDAGEKTISLVYAGTSLSEEQKAVIRDKSKDFSLGNVRIDFQQGLAFDEISKGSEVSSLKAEITRLTQQLREKESRADSLSAQFRRGQQILEEITPLYPQIKSCSYSETFAFAQGKDQPEKIELVVFSTQGATPIPAADKEKIEQWLKAKLKSDQVQAYYSEAR